MELDIAGGIEATPKLHVAGFYPRLSAEIRVHLRSILIGWFGQRPTQDTHRYRSNGRNTKALSSTCQRHGEPRLKHPEEAFGPPCVSLINPRKDVDAAPRRRLGQVLRRHD